MHLFVAFFLTLLAMLPASAQIAPTEAELRAYGGLHAAAARGDVADIERRIASAEKKEATDSRHRTPLHVAAYQKQHDAARALIRLGADPNKLEIDRYDVLREADTVLCNRNVNIVLLIRVERGAIRKRNREPGVVRARRLDHVRANLQVDHAV